MVDADRVLAVGLEQRAAVGIAVGGVQTADAVVAAEGGLVPGIGRLDVAALGNARLAGRRKAFDEVRVRAQAFAVIVVADQCRTGIGQLAGEIDAEGGRVVVGQGGTGARRGQFVLLVQAAERAEAVDSLGIAELVLELALKARCRLCRTGRAGATRLVASAGGELMAALSPLLEPVAPAPAASNTPRVAEKSQGKNAGGFEHRQVEFDAPRRRGSGRGRSVSGS